MCMVYRLDVSWIFLYNRYGDSYVLLYMGDRGSWFDGYGFSYDNCRASVIVCFSDYYEKNFKRNDGSNLVMLFYNLDKLLPEIEKKQA